MWQSLLRNWIQQQARAKIYEEVAKAAQQKGPAASGAAGAGAHPPDCDVAIVFALGIESGGLQDLLANPLVTQGHGFTVRQGRLKGRLVVIMEAGIGAEAATRGTEMLIAGHRPKWVISAGFSGGLAPQLKTHDVVMANGLADTSGHQLSIELKVSPESLSAMKGVHVGRLLTVNKIVHTPQEKQALGAQHAALAADMESFAVGQVCSREKVRFLAVRVISDAMNETLPSDVTKLAQPKSLVGKLGAVTGAVWRRPSSVKDMLKLQQQAIVASDRLAKFLSGVIEQLVPEPPPPAETSSQQE